MKKILVFLVSLSLIFTSGCWDKVEIEDRMFVYAIAIDEIKPETPNQSEKPFYEVQNQNLKVIFMVPNPSKIISGNPDAFEEIKVEAQNMPEAVGMVNKKQNRELFFGNEKLIILGENLLKDEDELKDVVDWIDRDPLKSRSAFIVATKDIDSISKITPKLEKLIAPYIVGILKNQTKTATMISVDISEFLGKLKASGAAMLPLAGRQNDEIVVKDVALIKDNKMLGTIDDKYIRGYSIITNKLKGGRKLFKYKDKILSYHITGCSRNINLQEKDGKLVYRVNVKLEGDIEEFMLNEDLLKPDVVKELKQSIEEQVEFEMKEVVRFFQQDIGYDYLDLKDWTKKHKYDLYKKNEKNWNNVFKNAEFEFNIQAFIRRIGVVR